MNLSKAFEKFLAWLRSIFWGKEMEITLVGLQNSGKTTLANVMMVNGQFHEDMIPTVGFNMKKIKKGNVSLKLWDVGGQKQFRSMWERYCRAVDVIIYIVDSCDVDLFEEAKSELNNLMSNPMLKDIPLLFLANKNDLPEHRSINEMISYFDLIHIEDRDVDFISISAKDNINIDNVLDWLIKHAR